ncbi:MAG: AAA family ATPase, partial [Vicinamibacteria bacterium]
MTDLDISQLNDVVREQSVRVQSAAAEIRKVIVGQSALVERLLIALLCRGHLLVEGVPGLAKTLAIKTFARVLDLSFSRIQFTPDLLPADLVGTLIFQPKSGEFTVRKGPVFASLVLADEVNRAPAKVQSALLEAMQERQVTIGDTTYPLPEPFLVFATQNPIEQEGTYPLPEAQVDRFLMKARIDYPKKEEERQILDRMLLVNPDELSVTKRLDQASVLALAKLVRSIHLDERVRNYIIEIVTATR